MTLKRVPYVDLSRAHVEMKSGLLAAVAEVLESGDFILGTAVGRFEKWFADFTGSRFAAGVGNGTDALEIALAAAEIGPGDATGQARPPVAAGDRLSCDEVVTAPNSFVATAAAIVRVGARPVFADVLEDDTLDPEAVRAVITSRTRAIIPVHLYGAPARMGDFQKLARDKNLALIEDAAQAIGTRYQGRHVGTFGIGCFSLHPLKTLSAAGDGGVITTNSERLLAEFRFRRNLGLENRDSCVAFHGNSRLDSVHAAMLMVKASRLEEWILRRRAIADYYRETLAGLVELPVERPGDTHTYSTFVIRCDPRDKLIAHLDRLGIDAKIHYPLPLHLQKAAAALGYKKGSFPVTERHAETMLSLPSFPHLTEEERDRVAEGVRSFFGK